MSTQKHLDDLRRIAQAAPPAAGPARNGTLEDMLEAEEVRMFCLDDRGRVFSVTGDFSIKNATFQPLDNGRSAVIQAMDELQTLDVKWPVREG